MTTAVRLARRAGTAGGRGAKKARWTKPTTALVQASAIQEKLATNRTSSTHSSSVVPPSDTTLYISAAP